MTSSENVAALGPDRNRLRQKRVLNVYVPLGYPSLEASIELACLALQNGASAIELGFPFSDPAADGPVIQAATQAALINGVSLDDCFAAAALIRRRYPDAGLVAMTYANLAYRRGWNAFAKSAAGAGIDGVLLADVPLEESEPIRLALTAVGVAWVPLVTPTTPPERMQAIAATATGFLYVVGSLGITGQADPGPLLEAVVARAKAAKSSAPLLVGFGIASPTAAARVIKAGADGAIVGTYLVGLSKEVTAYGQAVADLSKAVNEATN